MSLNLSENLRTTSSTFNGGVYNLINRRHEMLSKEPFLLNSIDNPKTMTMMYAKGWSSDPYQMTKSDIAKISSLSKITSYDISGEDLDWLLYCTRITVVPINFTNGMFLSVSSFKIPPNTVTIQADAYRSLKVKVPFTLRIPASVRTIAARCFFYLGNYGKYTIIFEGTTVPSFDESCLGGAAANNLLEIYVPDSALNDYLTAWDGKVYNDITINDKVKPMSQYQQ